MATEMRFRQQFIFSLQMFSRQNNLQVPDLDNLGSRQVFGNCSSQTIYRRAIQHWGVGDKKSSSLATQLQVFNVGDMTLVANVMYWDDGSVNKRARVHIPSSHVGAGRGSMCL